MNGIMNGNQLTVFKEFEFNEPLIHKKVFIIDNCYRDCHDKNYHTFEYKCEFDIKPTSFANIDINILTIFDKSRGLYELNKKVTFARPIGFIFNQILKLTMKILKNQSIENIHFYSKFRIPIMHRKFFKIISQNPDYVKFHCNDLNNFFILHVEIFYRKIAYNLTI